MEIRKLCLDIILWRIDILMLEVCSSDRKMPEENHGREDGEKDF